MGAMTNRLVKVKVAIPPHIASALKRGTGKDTLGEAIAFILPMLKEPETSGGVLVKTGTKKAARRKMEA